MDFNCQYLSIIRWSFPPNHKLSGFTETHMPWDPILAQSAKIQSRASRRCRSSPWSRRTCQCTDSGSPTNRNLQSFVTTDVLGWMVSRAGSEKPNQQAGVGKGFNMEHVAELKIQCVFQLNRTKQKSGRHGEQKKLWCDSTIHDETLIQMHCNKESMEFDCRHPLENSHFVM